MPQPRSRHLDDAAILDYLEDRLAGDRRRGVEEHLGTPCAACRERVRDDGRVLEWMRLDRTPEVPTFLHARALEVFAPALRPAPAARTVASLARLLFDSWGAPLPAAARRAVGEARRLRFGLGEHVLEIEIEREARGAATLRGWLDAPEPALHRIEVAARSERRVALPDAAGAFALERLPAGPLRITVSGPAGRWRLGPLELSPPE